MRLIALIELGKFDPVDAKGVTFGRKKNEKWFQYLKNLIVTKPDIAFEVAYVMLLDCKLLVILT